MTDEQTEKLKALLESALSILSGGGSEIPTPDELAESSIKEVKELAANLGIEIDGVKGSKVRELVSTASAITHGETALDVDVVNELAEAVGVVPSKKSFKKTIAALSDYFESPDSSEEDEDEEEPEEESEEDEDEEEEEPEDEDEEDEEGDDEEEDDEGEDEEDEEADEEDEDEGEEEDEDEEEPEEEEDEESDEEDDEEDDDEDEEDEEDEEEEQLTSAQVKTLTKRLEAFNKVAKPGEKINLKKLGPAKANAQLKKLLTDGDGDVAEWGAPYAKDDYAWCCGLKLANVKGSPDLGKCRVTGKVFTQNKKGELVEYKPPTSKKPAAKKPVSKKPAAKKPATKKPAAKKTVRRKK